MTLPDDFREFLRLLATHEAVARPEDLADVARLRATE